MSSQRLDELIVLFFVFFKQKTAYEMRISDWSSDVCSSDLVAGDRVDHRPRPDPDRHFPALAGVGHGDLRGDPGTRDAGLLRRVRPGRQIGRASCRERVCQYVWISVVAVSLNNKKT